VNLTFKEWFEFQELEIFIAEAAIAISADLVNSAINGDKNALQEVLEQVREVCRRWLFVHVPKFLGLRQDDATVEDLAQDGVLTIYQLLKEKSLKNPAAIVSAAISVVRNKLLTYNRDRRNHANVMGTHDGFVRRGVSDEEMGKPRIKRAYNPFDSTKKTLAPDSSVYRKDGEDIVADEEKGRFYAAISKLPHEYRAAMQTYLDDMPAVDAAAKLGIKRSTYDSIVSRAKSKIRTIISDEMPDSERRQFRRAMSELTDDRLKDAMAYKLQGLSPAAAAHKMNISVEEYKKFLYVAKSRIRKIMQQAGAMG